VNSAVRLIECVMNAPPEEWFTNYESGFFYLLHNDGDF
jgi:hypothetical protein